MEKLASSNKKENISTSTTSDKGESNEQYWKSLLSNLGIDWSSITSPSACYGSHSGYNTWSSGKVKKKHEFAPVFLITSSVYDCIHCKRKKENCKYDYCEDEETPPDDYTYDLEGW